MTRQQANITKFYSKLESFWNEQRYTDVTVECIDGSFKCHRLALATVCDYFDAMFGGKFKESVAESISLPTIHAATFEQVLKFVYTGNAVVNSSNVFGLLEASELFKLPGIEDLCVEYVLQKNDMTIQNTLDMFAFARATGKETLITILGGYIANHIDIYSRFDGFLNLPFDDLKFILDRLSSLLSQNAESLVSTVARWIHHHQEERLQHLAKLLKIIRFENMSTEYVRYAFEKFIANWDSTVPLTQFEKPIGYSENSELGLLKTARCEADAEPLLHVFIKHEEEKLMKVFTINKAHHCSISPDIILRDRLQFARSVSMDSHLYSLNNYYSSKETFYAYTSISMSAGLSLSIPPIIFGEIYTCTLQNNFYVCREDIFKKAIRRSSSHSTKFFDDKEINRGVFVYNCEVDNWYPVPMMKRQLAEPCFAASEGSLFLIGGIDFDQTVPEGYAQALDCRIGKWRELPKTHNTYSGAACCTIRGKIYVCGGRYGHQWQTERYDPVAGKWEETAPMNRGMYYHRAVNYLDQLWAVGSYEQDTVYGSVPSKDTPVEVYDPILNTWSSFPALQTVTEEAAFSGYMLEAVVF